MCCNTVLSFSVSGLIQGVDTLERVGLKVAIVIACVLSEMQDVVFYSPLYGIPDIIGIGAFGENRVSFYSVFK